MKPIKNIQILLIQIRLDPSMIGPERKSFVDLASLEESQWHTLDVFRNPDFSASILDNYDAFMIGGLSDDHSDSVQLPQNFLPWIKNLYDLMTYAIKIKKPGMLSCGGFMLASEMLGSEIVIDPAQQELGVYSLNLTSGALKDPLFRGFPNSFKAVSGHIKTTNSLPQNCQLLAISTRCAIHGFKVKTAPFYAFQFHPEIKCQDLKIRVELYKEKYFDSETTYQKFIALMADTAVANSLVMRFIQLVQQSAD